MSRSCVFFGTPEFALPSLQALVGSTYRISAVVTRPDKPAGRGRQVIDSPVKRFALSAGLPVLQPARLRDDDTLVALRSLAPDFIVVAAYGLLIPPPVLALPPQRVLNIHPSLLPRHRGASPIQGAIIAGDDQTGVSIMLMDEGLDTGPVLTSRKLPIRDHESAGELSGRLAAESASLLLETIPRWLNGELRPEPQDEAQATYSPQVKKGDAILDWHSSAMEIWRHVRAFNPAPGAETTLNGARLKIWRAWPLERDDQNAPPGSVQGLEEIDAGEGLVPALIVNCGTGSLGIIELQKEGRRPLSADEFARGERNLRNTILGSSHAAKQL